MDRPPDLKVGETSGKPWRGAKDLAAFGPVLFESIHDGRYVRMLLEEDGTYDDPLDRKARDEDRSDLGIPRGSGTTVRVQVSERFKCPQHQRCWRDFHFTINCATSNSDPRREIISVDLNSSRSDSIRYGKPALPEAAAVELAIDGYPDAAASLTVYRNIERYENGSSDTGRPEGILVKGRRAIYENTLFSLEGNPYSHWFSGFVRCPEIDALALAYDQEHLARKEHGPLNPIPIITRSRGRP